VILTFLALMQFKLEPLAAQQADNSITRETPQERA
jgi:hypothetical protein